MGILLYCSLDPKKCFRNVLMYFGTKRYSAIIFGNLDKYVKKGFGIQFEIIGVQNHMVLSEAMRI